MIEHVMAALAGLQIDNCEVWVDQPEMPGCDGSALPFVEALDAAGIVEQDATRRTLVIRQIVRLGNERELDRGPALPLGQDDPPLRTGLRQRQPPSAGNRWKSRFRPSSSTSTWPPAARSCWKREAAALQAQGLGQRATCKDLLVFDSRGPIDNQLRFPDECVRHKMVDMVGDLALAGCDLVGRFVAYRSGHRLNAELVRAIVAQNEVQKERKRCA